MQFARLKLTGFKSFVDPTELLIEPGMTGIVGPNGCGKSNLVEALRWVMGETSAKQMRGSGMDDVIFNGTSTRPKRNLAEVALTLENDGHDIGNSVGQPALNDVDTVIVARRIEREKGSGYKLNGADIRARDVQLLFADHASGARSPALVSQGRVGAIINAKPADRRKILEDAAGVSGLHSRRHEAELRLRAARGNLQRLEDVTGTIETQLNSLLRQARQARRYNSLNDAVRRMDALRLYIRWMQAVAALNKGEAGLAASEQALAEATRRQSACQRERDEAIAKLPGLRTRDAQARAKLNRISNEKDNFLQEQERREEQRIDTALRAEQIQGDRDREARLLRDMEEALIALDNEHRQILDQTEADQMEDRVARLETEIAKCAEQAEHAETALDQMLADTATMRSQVQEYDRRHAQLKAQKSSVQQKIEATTSRLLQLEGAGGSAIDIYDQPLQQRQQDLTDLAALQTETDGKRQDLARKLETADQDLQAMRQARLSKEQELREEQQHQDAVMGHQIAAAENDVDRVAQSARQAKSALDHHLEQIAVIEKNLPHSQQEAAPVLASLTVDPGYEQALAVALDAALEAPVRNVVSSDHPFAWHPGQAALPEFSMPPGTTCLAGKVSGPNALDAVLASIFVLDDENKGDSLMPALSPGQAIVSKSGALWRWDGYMIAAGAPNTAARQMAQKNALSALQASLPDMRQMAESETLLLTAVQEKLADLRSALTHQRQQHSRAQQELQQVLDQQENSLRSQFQVCRNQDQILARNMQESRDKEANLRRQITDLQAKREKLLESRAAAVEERASLEAQMLAHKEQLAQIDADELILQREAADPAALATLEAGQSRCRQDLTTARQAEQQARAALDQFRRDQQQRQQRLVDIVSEKDSRESRRKDAKDHLLNLEHRHREASLQLQNLSEDEEALARKERQFDRLIEEATEERDKEAAQLAEADNRFLVLDSELKDASEALTKAREDRIRAEASIEQARQNRNDIGKRIAEDLETAPHELWKLAEIEVGSQPADLQPVDEVETELDRLKRQRDGIGPVNLRAEVEAEELKTQMGALLEEKADLEAAIAKLHEGIDQLNQEGRSRLLAAFEEVDANFGKLFKRLFGGGRAHLTLVESDDPLNAGLEIMASPPGKKLTTLSLLSGGEQALTATALLFGVFLTNPAPICVLDEVDAPLDDANTERFATLIEEIVRLSSTRFLVVTHNPLTMARMNRLYGVTMTERGVSRMLSVDLEKAEEIIDGDSSL